jgi:hypothetical protein
LVKNINIIGFLQKKYPGEDWLMPDPLRGKSGFTTDRRRKVRQIQLLWYVRRLLKEEHQRGIADGYGKKKFLWL